MPNVESSRIRTLDGWRGIAILAVMVDHAATYTRYNDLLLTNLGSFGVDIFFVLSGYIITLRFLEERKKTSTLSLPEFYARRAFRILPLVIVYLSTLCIFSLFVNLEDFHSKEILGSLFFFRNYQYASNPSGIYTTHFWSLSIEEHFYLLWPSLLLWLGNRRALWLTIAGAFSCAVWRAYYLAHSGSWLGQLFPGVAGVLWRTDTRFDGLLLGSATAIVLSLPSARNFIFRNFPKETPLMAGLLIILNLVRTTGMPTSSTYLLVCLALASTLVIEEGLVHKWLNLRVLVWIGTISYSIYVWQQMFFFHPSMNVHPLGILGSLPLSIVCVIGVSALSFYFVEKPCIAFGKRMLVKHKDSSVHF
jgi:peptidoglycan/LPS O-acetylase OafA/YrhL